MPAASSFQTPVPDEPRTPVVSTPTPSQETTIESKSKIGPKFNPKASVFLPSFVAPHPVAIAAPLPMAVHMTPVHAPLPPQVVQSSTEVADSCLTLMPKYSYLFSSWRPKSVLSSKAFLCAITIETYSPVGLANNFPQSVCFKSI